ncbi:MAG: 1-acyl-sn-glycerol-3-phosphate acyltransferase [Bacteroidales bacterium]|nr:1-acyl-sn-glycerol-3-phosphate acyltransferase [Bacteroidales bacterium]MCL2738620.1 1-acyl-sn-glycerol-3-phosphate acyltransferase [Bacteroidales bacterium]
MSRRFCALLLKWLGWKCVGGPVAVPKCIILGAPHTSVWDFLISVLFYRAVGGKASILVKKEFFIWPLGRLLKRLGGIPVDRSKGVSLVKQVVEAYNAHEHLHIAIAPEGTRKPTAQWKGGFYTIAKAAHIPVYLGFFDWGKKEVGVAEELPLSDNQQADIKRVRQWYKDRGVVGKYPTHFITGTDID